MFGIGKSRRPLDAIERMGLDGWLAQVGLDTSGARYNLYRGAPLSETPLSTCVTGMALSRESVDVKGGMRYRAFCVEMYQGRVYEGVLMDARYATKDKGLSLQCRAQRLRLIDAFRQIAPCENWHSSEQGSAQTASAPVAQATSPGPTSEPAPQRESPAISWGEAFVADQLRRYDLGEISASDAKFRLAAEYHRHVEAIFEEFDCGELTSGEAVSLMIGRGGEIRKG